MIVFEDSQMKIEVLEKGAVAGHVRISPLQDVKYLCDLPQAVAQRMFSAASFAATILFQGLGLQGTNILAMEGERVYVDVLGRKQDDGIDLFWEPKPADKGELASVGKQIADKMWYVGKESDAPVTPAAVKEKPPAEAKKESYKLKHIMRSP